jgi:hypothetical protein
MAVIPRQVTDPLVATIKTPSQAGAAVVVERRGMEMSSQFSHPWHRHPHLESVSDTGVQVCHIVSWGENITSVLNFDIYPTDMNILR